MPEQAPQPDTPESPDQNQEEQGGYQKRIDALTRNWREEERRNEDLSTQLAAVQQKLDNQEKLLAARLNSSASPDTEFADLFGSSQTIRSTKGKSLPTEDLNQQVANTVASLIQPLVDRFEEKERREVIGKQHQESFNTIAQHFPELRNAGSNLNLAFGDIWESIPELKNIPNGPAIAGAAAVGILQQESRALQQDARKVAASGPSPSGNLSGRLEALPGPKDMKNAQLVNDLHAKGRTIEGLEQNELSALIGIKLGQADAKE